ncbi:MAG: hypothetical protein ACKPEA_13165, partial [Planctomycetota bacterium]
MQKQFRARLARGHARVRCHRTQHFLDHRTQWRGLTGPSHGVLHHDHQSLGRRMQRFEEQQLIFQAIVAITGARTELREVQRIASRGTREDTVIETRQHKKTRRNAAHGREPRER